MQRCVRLFINTQELEFDKEKLLRLAKFGFSQKRKKLRNSLSAGLHIKPNTIDCIIKETGVDPNYRAEDLDISQWRVLAQRLL